MAPASRHPLLIALLVAVLVVSGRAAWWFLQPADFQVAVLPLVAGWVAASLVLAQAVWLVLRTWNAARGDLISAADLVAASDPVDSPLAPVDRTLSPRRVSVAWVIQAGLSVLLWPYALDPLSNTMASAIYWSALLIVPVAIAESRPADSTRRRHIAIYIRCAMWVCLVASVLAAGVYLQRSRPFIGGVDFFFFLCNARDMRTDPTGVALNAYRYFPGAYAYWRTILWSAGGELASLQGAVVALLIANAVLCSAVVFRLTRNMAAGVFAAVWYLVVSSRFQGLSGVVEPLATLPFLLGLLCWGGMPLRGGGGLVRAAALGAGLGGALLVKQQAGLLALGAGWLLISYTLAPPARRHWLLGLGLLPLSAIGVVAAGILGEGRGWTPLWQALNMLSTYPAQGSWPRNLYVQLRGDESLAVIGLMVGVGLVGILGSAARRRGLIGAPWLELAGFCLVAAVATLLQFRTRPYGHYLLLAIPALIVAAVTLAARLVPVYLRQGRDHPLRYALLLVAAALPLANTAGNPRTLHAWRLALPADFQPQQLWHQQPRVAADLRRLQGHIRPGQTLYVLPPRHNSTHYLLQTRSREPWGYSFKMPDLDAMPWQQFEGVLVLTSGLDESDQQVWGRLQIDEAQASLARAGFRPTVRLRTMTLFEPVSRK